MKRLLPVLLLAAGTFLSAAPAPSVAVVQIKAASLYAKPSATAAFLGKVPYGAKVSVLAVQNDWGQVKVEGSALSGWMRTQAFTTKDLALKAGTEVSSVSTTEVSLAGRGFTDVVETQYRQDHPELNFATLDKMESQVVAPQDLDAFLKDAGLKADGARK